MTIQITKPEVEALINQRLQTGGFKDAEDVVLHALQCSRSTLETMAEPAVTPVNDVTELFAPLRGLNLDFGRNPSNGRPTDF
jgi:hypothetical protein